MSIKSSLQGRLRNTNLKPNTPLLPLFEAVVNSIHATSDAGLKGGEGFIRIDIRRGSGPAQQSMEFSSKGRVGAPKQEDIVGFDITDNGIGFNDANLESFTTLDSMYKASEGGKGIGRLTWLKAFDTVSVDSTFVDVDNNFARRSFTFSEAEDGVGGLTEVSVVAGPAETTIHLSGFHPEYRTEAPKTAQAIARRLIEHCLWYFIRAGGAPRIVISDGSDAVVMSEVYDEYMRSSIQDESITIKGKSFDLDHIKLKSTAQSDHFIALLRQWS